MEISVIGTIALALVSSSLLLTLVFQFRPLSQRGPMLDLLGIVPRWKFFLLEYGTFDVAIDWRGRDHSGAPGEWRTIWSALPRRRWGWLWRPEAFGDAVTWLAIHTLEKRVVDGKPACPATSGAYASILDLCRRSGMTGEGQFALVRLTPDGARSIRFSSTFHIC